MRFCDLATLLGTGALVAAGAADASLASVPLTLRSPVFDPGAAIPRKYTCEGSDVSPPLAISGIPGGARSLVLIVDDPDAPDPKAPKRTWVHWVVYNLPPDLDRLGENAQPEQFPGAAVALNDWKRSAYRGPCPPIGRHRYFHKLYALDVSLPDLGPNASKRDVEAAMAGHIVGEAVLVGTYEKTPTRSS